VVDAYLVRVRVRFRVRVRDRVRVRVSWVDAYGAISPVRGKVKISSSCGRRSCLG